MLLTALIGLAGADGPSVVVTQPDESKFPEITVYFEVKNPDGSFILDAKRDQFRVAEDGRDRPILRFEAPESTEVRPTTVVLVVDRSLSMLEDDRLAALKRSVATFLDGVPKGSRVAVVAFCAEAELICDFTTDYPRVREIVDALTVDNGTAYYDAVADALDLLAGEPGRRAILALTDGEDNASRRSSLPRVIVKARGLGLPVHTLGLGDESKIAVDALGRLATGTRGQHYLARDAAQLRTIYEEIARGLGSGYSLAYQTDRKVADGTLRPIRITYEKAARAAETAVFIRGMVVPAAGWSRLFLVILAGLGLLALLPALFRRRAIGGLGTRDSMKLT